ncbi:MAG: hypothetical protein Q8942_15445 [Bacillota bacterium]|nr:hypothetical protein [Bacillota bacterium]
MSDLNNFSPEISTNENLAIIEPNTSDNASTKEFADHSSIIMPQIFVPMQEECLTCNSNISNDYVYVIGSIKPDFPTLDIKNEFNQAAGRLSTVVSDDYLYYAVLSQDENVNISRDMCWLLQVDGNIDTYIIQPRTYPELYEMVGSTKPSAGKTKYVVAIGLKGPIAPPQRCNNAQLPLLLCNQIYSFTQEDFVSHVSSSISVDESVVLSMFKKMLQLSDNAGNTDAHRAVNYLTIKYDGIYIMAGEMMSSHHNPHTFVDLSVKPSDAQGDRNIVDVIFRFEERKTGKTIYWFCRVDVTGQFPFLVNKISRYYPGP